MQDLNQAGLNGETTITVTGNLDFRLCAGFLEAYEKLPAQEYTIDLAGAQRGPCSANALCVLRQYAARRSSQLHYINIPFEFEGTAVNG